MKAWAAAVAIALLVACVARTEIRAVTKPKPSPVFVGDKSCMVQDFDNATDVPEGAKPLGQVAVPEQGDDEATYIEMRRRICEMGGDALSQPAWVKDSDQAKPVLRANAWVLP